MGLTLALSRVIFFAFIQVFRFARGQWGWKRNFCGRTVSGAACAIRADGAFSRSLRGCEDLFRCRFSPRWRAWACEGVSPMLGRRRQTVRKGAPRGCVFATSTEARTRHAASMAAAPTQCWGKAHDRYWLCTSVGVLCKGGKFLLKFVAEQANRRVRRGVVWAGLKGWAATGRSPADHRAATCAVGLVRGLFPRSGRR